MRIRIALITGLLIVATAGPINAGFTLTGGNVTAPAGSTVSLDVIISGPERLDLFVGEFVLTAVGGASPGKVEFVTPVPLPPLSDPNYAFPDVNSFAVVNLPSNPASVLTTAWTKDTYQVSDATLDGLGVDVFGGKLLARVSIAISPNATAGDTYRLSLGANSVFQTVGGIDTSVAIQGGDIVVAGSGPPSSVPTPAGLTLLATGLVPITGRWLRRRLPARM